MTMLRGWRQAGMAAAVAWLACLMLMPVQAAALLLSMHCLCQTGAWTDQRCQQVWETAMTLLAGGVLAPQQQLPAIQWEVLGCELRFSLTPMMLRLSTRCILVQRAISLHEWDAQCTW